MDDELILPEADTPVAHLNDGAAPAGKNHSRRTVILAVVIAIVFVTLATSLIIVITQKPTPSEPIPETPEETDHSLIYDQSEFDDALNHAYDCLADGNYYAINYYVNPYSATERMTLAQKYRFYSLYAEMYSESYINDVEQFQKYTDLVNSTLKSMREGANS